MNGKIELFLAAATRYAEGLLPTVEVCALLLLGILSTIGLLASVVRVV